MDKDNDTGERNFLTEKEVVAEYRTSRQTLWRERERGLPFYRVGSKVLYKRLDLDLHFRKVATVAA